MAIKSPQYGNEFCNLDQRVLQMYSVKTGNTGINIHGSRRIQDHWTYCGTFENGVLFMYPLEGVSNVANFITAYEESQ